jgi:F-type H+-transporting ATPase subunit delta
MGILAGYARPYARAAFDFSVAAGGVQGWEKMLAALKQILSVSGVQGYLSNPSVGYADKVALVLRVGAGLFDSHFENFIRLLAGRSRLSLASEILDLFIAFRLAHESTVKVEVVSAEPLESAALAAIVAKLEKRFSARVEASTSVDSSLIGGFIVKGSGVVIDASLQGKLKRLAGILN